MSHRQHHVSIRRHHDDAWKNIVAGAIGGLAASWVMNRYQGLQHKAVDTLKRGSQSEGERAIEEGREAVAGKEPSSQAHQESSQSSEPATTRAAEVISINVLRRQLTEKQKKVADPVVHYSFGTLMGAWYGVLSELTPIATLGRGSLFGAVVWLGADEIAVPALKLSNSPFEYPLSAHASALSTHAVYGITTDTVRRAVLKLIA